MSPSLFDTPNMFALSGHSTPRNNDYFKSIGNGATNNRLGESQRTDKHTPRNGIGDALDSNEASFFDFDPPTNAESPLQDQLFTPGALNMPWANETQYRPLSPPDSASFSPLNPWALSYQHQQRPQIFTDIDPVTTRTHHGQVTPPDDEEDNINLLDHEHHEGKRQQQKFLSSNKKRKQNGAHERTTQPTKRSRNHAQRASDVKSASDKPEDVKRSKFLERNRVAASKCRQKKKEWTQNLESRARDLQKTNNMLRLNVESLREEILFLKGEMLKHSTCDCKQIQAFMKTMNDEVIESAESGMIFKQEQSPIGSMPGSPISQRQDRLCDFDSTPAVAEQSNGTNTSVVDDENALEALLSSSIGHYTSDEAIASQTAN